MKMIFKTAVGIVTALSIITSVSYASVSSSDWARASVEMAERAGIIPSGISLATYNTPISRGQIAHLISNAYLNVTEKENEHITAPFSDVSGDVNIALVHSLGIMNGRGDGIFDPDAITTRQEMAKIILSFGAVANGEVINISKNNKLNFTDADTISDWAVPYVAKASGEGIIKGYDDGSFGALLPVTWEQAIALVVRSVKLNEKADAYTVEWKGKKGAEPYTVKITEERMPRYEGDIPLNDAVVYETNEKSIAFYVNPNRKYTVEISGKGYEDVQEIIVPRVDVSDIQGKIKESYPTSKEEADALMRDVEVPVWRMKESGEKYSASMMLTVHSLIADRVKAVFEEIYAGDEKFPIKDAGAYAWRSGTTEHNSGTAIDINYNENYCLYSDGTTVGEYWKPYEDPYSITPYGDVIRAFEKYGFTWGGDAWSNPKDYMHFSFMGT